MLHVRLKTRGRIIRGSHFQIAHTSNSQRTSNSVAQIRRSPPSLSSLFVQEDNRKRSTASCLAGNVEGKYCCCSCLLLQFTKLCTQAEDQGEKPWPGLEYSAVADHLSSSHSAIVYFHARLEIFELNSLRGRVDLEAKRLSLLVVRQERIA